MKQPYVASRDQVRISRDGEDAIIEYAEPGVATTHLRLGPEVARLTDEEILGRHNEVLVAQRQLADEHVFVAVEIPPGRPQIRFEERSQQWVPRGEVVRCLVDDSEQGEVVIDIDGHELSLEEFGRMIKTHAGWGMRIVFVPDDEIAEPPTIVVRDGKEER
jgi:hypothetical protein